MKPEHRKTACADGQVPAVAGIVSRTPAETDNALISQGGVS